MYIKNNSSMVVELLATDESTVKMTLPFGSKSSITKKQDYRTSTVPVLCFEEFEHSNNFFNKYKESPRKKLFFRLILILISRSNFQNIAAFAGVFAIRNAFLKCSLFSLFLSWFY